MRASPPSGVQGAGLEHRIDPGDHHVPEITASPLLIDEGHTELAVRTLHSLYELDR